MSKPMRVFVPITKVDQANRLVYGRVADETPDAAGEVFDYATSKPYFEKWSGSIAKASGGKSLGNVRVMHTAKAAGKVTDLAFNDDDKTIDVCTKCVDDDEWKKVEAGVYTGFSMGGSYVKKWKDGDHSRYTGNPVEISYVDAPCIPTATFEFGKADGATEMRKFTPWEPTAAEVAVAATAMVQAGQDWTMHIEAARSGLIATRAGADEPLDEELVKAFGAKDGGAKDDKAAADAKAADEKKVTGDQTQGKDDGEGEDPKKKKDTKVDGLAADGDAPADDAKKADAARELVKQVWTATDGKTFDKKEDCVKHQLTVGEPAAPAAPVNPLTKAVADLTHAVKGDVKPEDPLRKVLEARPEGTRDLAVFAKLLPLLDKAASEQKGDVLRKSMWDIGRFSDALSTLSSIQMCMQSEADYEKDGSKVPADLRSAIAGLVGIFLSVAYEESAEMLASLPGGEMITLDAAADPELAVAAANAYKAVQPNALEKIGARNSGADKKRLQGIHDYLVELGVACAPETAEKLAKSVGENAELNKVIADALPAIEQLRKDVEHLRAQPMPGGPGRLSVVEKGGAASVVDPAADTRPLLTQLLEKHSPEELSMMLIKQAQVSGRPMQDRGTHRG